jgi:hypothetical protein
VRDDRQLPVDGFHRPPQVSHPGAGFADSITDRIAQHRRRIDHAIGVSLDGLSIVRSRFPAGVSHAKGVRESRFGRTERADRHGRIVVERQHALNVRVDRCQRLRLRWIAVHCSYLVGDLFKSVSVGATDEQWLVAVAQSLEKFACERTIAHHQPRNHIPRLGSTGPKDRR